jgi:GH24 family phage-related lysozyme (muramidase)
MSDLGDYYDGRIKKFEGFAPRAQWDYKQSTNGWGTRARSANEVIDSAEAQRRFDDEINKAHKFVNGFAPHAPDGVRAALTSLTFNAGDKWSRSGLGERIRAGDYDGARERFLQYTKAGGETLPGLVNRRNGEAEWFGGGSQPLAAPGPQMPPQNAGQMGAAQPVPVEPEPMPHGRLGMFAAPMLDPRGPDGAVPGQGLAMAPALSMPTVAPTVNAFALGTERPSEPRPTSDDNSTTAQGTYTEGDGKNGGSWSTFGDALTKMGKGGGGSPNGFKPAAMPSFRSAAYNPGNVDFMRLG